MSDLSLFYKKLFTVIEAGNPVWQASVIETDGSTPARVGMKLAVPLTGEPFGNLGGGEMEYLVINAIRSDQPTAIVKWNYTLDEQGKTIESRRSTLAALTDISVNIQNDRIVDSAIQTAMICGGNVQVLIEPLFSPHPLYIIGAGHCGRALAEFAVKTDFQVTVIDNRQDLLQTDAFPPECKLIFNDYLSLDSVVSFQPSAFIVIMTYGHVHDRMVLEFCLRQPFRYLGMIGSKKKVVETLERVKSNGFTEADIQKVHAPIGLPIHSHTPYEIAVSILAELIQIKNSSQ
jgi:xanthine dehydrogenase accessory factor